MRSRSPRILEAAALALIATATIAGSSLAAGKPGYPDRVIHLNLWLFGGAAPSNGASVDVVVESFSFAP